MSAAVELEQEVGGWRRVLAPLTISALALAALAVDRLPPLPGFASSSEPAIAEPAAGAVEGEAVAEAATPPEPRPYTAEARALLGGLSIGDEIAGWRVTAAAGPLVDGSLELTLQRDELRFTAVIAPKGSRPYNAPVNTRGHDLFYNGVDDPRGEAMTAVTAALSELQRRVEANETE